MQKMEIRKATLDDFENLYRICKSFYNESNFSKYTFSKEKTVETVNAMCMGSLECHLFYVDDVLAGMAAWTYESYCTVEPTAHLFLFYIDPAARGAGVARKLAEHIDVCARRAGAAAFYVASTGGFADNGTNQQLFVNLFSKFGFRHAGQFLIKEYETYV